MAKVFTFSRKVFFIFNIFPSFDLSTTCVVVITWFCGYFLRRQFWLLLFVWYTISSTCSRSIYFLYSFRYHIDNVIRILSAVLFCSLEWKKCDLESNRSAFNLPEKRMKKRGKDKKVWLHFIFFSRNVFNQMPYFLFFATCNCNFDSIFMKF